MVPTGGRTADKASLVRDPGTDFMVPTWLWFQKGTVTAEQCDLDMA